MKVDPLAITRYKIHKWYNAKKHDYIYGIDVIIDGKCYHVKHGKPLWFKTKSEAIKHVRKLNKELRAERSVAHAAQSTN
jgi:hypothetical protein